MSTSNRSTQSDPRTRYHDRLDEWNARLESAERQLRLARTGAGRGARQSSSSREDTLATRLTDLRGGAADRARDERWS